MKNKILAISLLILLTTVSLASISFTSAAGEGQWITAYTIRDGQTNQLLIEFDSATGVNRTVSPVLPGAELQVTFTVNVITSGPGNLKLQTGLAKSSIHTNSYWELTSTDYDLGSKYNPNSAQTEFNWVAGTFTMVLYGKAPATVSSTSKPINVVSLLGETSGTPIDQIKVSVVTAEMDQYLSLYQQQQAKLRSLINDGVNQGYIEIFTNVLNASQTAANAGNVDVAIALLRGLNVSNAPASSTMQMLFIPLIGVMAVIAVIFAILFLRVRGKVGYFQLVVEDQIKDLEGLTLRASKIDRSMSSSLESVKDRLKNLVGM
ncbi:MAG: hypothetical protein NWE98_09360 [Candidatus Bathyarchaeota archaeon]|nr:hypothetical protein [Candidatus Bathyarchaeota archaeon]